MYICLCLGVTTITVQRAIDAGARSTKQVAEACGAGSVCGRCGHTIRTMIEAASADPPASKPPRLHRRWGRSYRPAERTHPPRCPPLTPVCPTNPTRRALLTPTPPRPGVLS
jgi:bacterioferritin-associated ferredoxin